MAMGSLGALERSDVVIAEDFVSPAWKGYDCHGTSLVEVAPGQLCAVWKGGFGQGRCNIEQKSGVGIWRAFYEGGSWGEPELIVDGAKTVCWTPALVKLDDELLLFFRVGSSPRSAVAAVKRSVDGGLSWSQAEALPAGIIGPTRGKALVLENGTLLCGSSTEFGEPDEEWKATACWIDVSPDAGKSWQKYGPIEIPDKKFGAIEPSLFHDQDGHLRLVCRDRSLRIGHPGYIHTATSEDEGKTWSTLVPTSLPNPDSGIDVLDLGHGKILLFYNHSSRERFPLNVALSIDGGTTWKEILTLETLSGEFPSAILTSDGRVHLTYAFTETCQRRIKHLILDLKDAHQ